MVVLGALVPHPPIIVPAVGGNELGKVVKTTESLARLAGMLAEAAPETIIIFTPHGNVFQDCIAVTGIPMLEGDLSRFGDDKRWSWPNDLDLAAKIVRKAEASGLAAILLDENHARSYRMQTTLDHGVLVPLSYLTVPLREVKLTVVGMSFLPLEDLYSFGRSVAEAAEETGRRVAVIASGDLSHRLTPQAPAGYDPRGREFDRTLVELLANTDIAGIMNIDPVLAEKAGECGYRTIVMMLGCLDGRAVKSEVLSYEGPFGVGYAVAALWPAGADASRRFGGAIRESSLQEMAERRKNESPLVVLARETAEAYARGEKPRDKPDLPPEARTRAGVFVSIKKHGQLRGCIGTVSPVRRNVAEEIRANAIAASAQDPRFEPVEADELGDLVYSVDVLGPAEPAAGLEDLDPRRYGVIVRRGGRQGLLLPNLEGIETAEEQVAIARRKAGIGPGEEVQMERFEVIRYY